MSLQNFYSLVAGRPKALTTQYDLAFLPSTGQKDALVGTGSPGSGDKYVNDSDARMTNARTPSSHGNEAHSSTFITAGGVTYEALSANGDIGTAASTVAAGDDSRFSTTDQKAALGAAPNALTAANPVADKTYVDALLNGLDWQDSVDHTIDYVKTTTGAPIGSPASGEKCLNTFDKKLFTESGGSWDAGAASSSGDRYVHKDTGTITNGDAGTHTKSNKIYDYNGTTYDETVANEGMSFWAEDEDALYVYNGTAYVTFGAVTTHNNLSGIQGSGNYHISANEQAGISAATAITASNVPLTSADRDRIPVPVDFVYAGGFAASQTDVEVYEEAGIVQQKLMPSAGSIVKITYQSTDNRSAGTLTLEPTINGTKVVASDLDLVIDADPTNDAKAEVAPATTNLTFTAGQKLGIKATSDGTWVNNSGDLQITLYVVFNT